MMLIKALCLVFLLLSGCSSEGSRHPTYRLARDPSGYPVDLFSSERRLLGFQSDLFDLIGKEMGFQVEFINTPYSSLFEAIEEGDADGLIGSIAPSPAQKIHYLFSKPFYLIGPVLVVPVESRARSMADMDNKIIAVINRSPWTLDIATYPGIFVRPVDDLAGALELVDADQVDGVILGLIPAYYYTQGLYGGRLKIAVGPLTEDGFRVIAPLDVRGATLIQKFDEGLGKLKESGEYDALLRKWGMISVTNGVAASALFQQPAQ